MEDIVSKLRASAGIPGGTGSFLDVQTVVLGIGVVPGMRVADFGCGAGIFTIELAKKVGKDGHVYALDVQEPPLETVREKARTEGLVNIETIRANLEVAGGSSLPENSQDVVLMANILFQSSKKADILKEAKRILKSGGVLVMIEWKKGVGGFGPPENLRTDTDALQSIATSEGFVIERTVNAGQYHLGLIFRK
jgi:ubiquinone/menaquinone biosynthesis C-methylase UbiE